MAVLTSQEQFYGFWKTAVNDTRPPAAAARSRIWSRSVQVLLVAALLNWSGLCLRCAHSWNVLHLLSGRAPTNQRQIKLGREKHTWANYSMELESCIRQQRAENPEAAARRVREHCRRGIREFWVSKWRAERVSPRLGGINPLWGTIDRPQLLYKEHPRFVLGEDAELLQSAALLEPLQLGLQDGRLLRLLLPPLPFVGFRVICHTERRCWTLTRQRRNGVCFRGADPIRGGPPCERARLAWSGPCDDRPGSVC